MPKKEQENRRRFDDVEDKDRKAWTEEQRKEFTEHCDKLRPYIRHLTTPARAPKKKGFLDDLPTVT